MVAALNETAHLSMSEITKELFNRKFLSDIHFTVDGKIIYAHSLELMKRSIVFQEQLESTMGEKKLIPITDYKYESFYQFIRFCYTDQCNISDDNVLELFKLSRAYRIIKLENKVINYNSNLESKLLLFEYSVLENYVGLRSHLEVNLSQNYSACLRSETFLKLHPDAVVQLLQFDSTDFAVRELDIFEALVRWMNNYCAVNGIDLAQRRTMFHKQIHSIRFPTIRIRDLREFKIRYRELLTKEDFMTIGSQVTFDYEIEELVWNSKMRQKFTLPVEWKSYPAKQKFESKFIVMHQYLLTGLRFCNPMRGVVEIQFTESTKDGIDLEVVTFNQELISEYPVNFINLGETFTLSPRLVYKIGVNFVPETDDEDECEDVLALYRCDNEKVICNEPRLGVIFSLVSPNLIEILVRPVEEDVVENEVEREAPNSVEISEEELEDDVD